MYAATNFLNCDPDESDDYDCAIGDGVIQPGTFDGGSSPADDIGELAAYKNIVFGTCTNNTNNRNVMDAAIASTGDLGNATPSTGYGTPKSETIAAVLNMKVQKFGRTTRSDEGRGGRGQRDDERELRTDRRGHRLLHWPDFFAGSFFNTIISPIDPILAQFEMDLGLSPMTMTIDGN